MSWEEAAAAAGRGSRGAAAGSAADVRIGCLADTLRKVTPYPRPPLFSAALRAGG